MMGVSRDQAPSKGALPLRVLPPSLQLCSQTSGPWHGSSPRLPVGAGKSILESGWGWLRCLQPHPH